MGQHVIKLKSMLLILREVKEHTACKGLSLHPGIVAEPLISRHAASHQVLRLPVTPTNNQVSPDQSLRIRPLSVHSNGRKDLRVHRCIGVFVCEASENDSGC